MFLDAPVAQKLVDRMMESLGCNVNMMDGRGVIIASGEPDRIGKLHVGACLVLERKETVQCFDTTDAGAESTQPGINMPLCHAGEVVGLSLIHIWADICGLWCGTVWRPRH